MLKDRHGVIVRHNSVGESNIGDHKMRNNQSALKLLMFDFFSTAQCKVIALKTRKNDIKRWMSDSYRQRNVEKST